MREAPDPMFYRQRAARVEAARIAVNAAARRRVFTNGGTADPHPSIVEWQAKVVEFWAAMDAMYPAEFWEDFDRLKAGEPGAADFGITFLEADPLCQRSGYLKADLLRFLARAPLTKPQADRLRAVIVTVAAERDGREFRRYCSLARKLDTISLRGQLRAMAVTGDGKARRRAMWVLAALPRAAPSQVTTA